MEFKAYISGLLVLLLFWVFYRILLGTWSPSLLIDGEDGKASTSKFQWFLWTIVVIFCFVVIFAARAWTGNFDVISNIPQNLLIVMGFSITSMVAAKGITSAYTKSGQIVKVQSNPAQTGLSWILKDDEGQPDLSKVQIIAWTLISIVVYLIRVIQEVHTGSALLLPDIDPALMVLMGLGHGAYIGKKIVTTNDSGVNLRNVAQQGQTIMQYQSSVIPNVAANVPVSPPSPAPQASSVSAPPPPPQPVPGAPQLTTIAPGHGPAGTTVTLTGIGFGAVQNQSFITLDGLATHPDGTTWSDTQITFPFPPQGGNGIDWAAGQTVQVGVVVNGVKSENALLFGVGGS
ncbi:MAG: IPT/TIG domain-containing protein [Ignavibacteriae bacterium]|nr:IPT/TIG domain-containing protein [Ignavibacteriota bacterium]MCB9214416.1 IPT/TIG domain-containing protein [Ignavibacteria bacterium]